MPATYISHGGEGEPSQQTADLEHTLHRRRSRHELQLHAVAARLGVPAQDEPEASRVDERQRREVELELIEAGLAQLAHPVVELIGRGEIELSVRSYADPAAARLDLAMERLWQGFWHEALPGGRWMLRGVRSAPAREARRPPGGERVTAPPEGGSRRPAAQESIGA